MAALAAQRKPKTQNFLTRAFRSLRSRLPAGHALSEENWQHQHKTILVLLWLHAIGIVFYGVIADYPLRNSLLEASAIAVAAILAGVVRGGRRIRSALATLGLLTSSAVLVHLSGGFDEMHFQFFLIMVIVALYQDWVPFALAIGYIIGENVLFGLLDPTVFVYHGAPGVAGIAIHAAFIVAAAVAGLVHWRLDESTHVQLASEQVARAGVEQALHARDDVLSVVAHDLKDPLGARKGYAQLLRRQSAVANVAEAERTEDGLAKIEAAATKTAALVDDLLDVVRVEMGEALDLNLRRTDLVALARQVAAEYEPTTTRHRIIVDAAVPAVICRCDPDRIRRVLANLLSNAIKYSAGGDVVVHVDREDGRFGSWARLAVRDQGVGISPNELSEIFERFRRVHPTPGRVEGMGVGLASARLIVEQHGGSIRVSSQRGVGSTFVVRLPAPGGAAETLTGFSPSVMLIANDSQ
ncbi:MAG TPA: HAMP domain-containing sensor histidine kinase [Chloroflexota bacterium]|nr:HAMP domain-containing sensor histidine kinase [Chloroflexota bacterium]